MMKRKLGFILVCLFTVCALSACDFENIFGITQGTDDLLEFGNPITYIEEELTGDYSITCKTVTYSSGEMPEEQFSKTVRAPAGYYIMKGLNAAGTDDNAEHKIYVLEGDFYVCYSSTGSGGSYTKQGGQYTESQLNTLVSGSISFLSAHANPAPPATFKKEGEATIAGKTCAKFSQGFSIAGFASMTHTYYIDKASGMCLKYAINASASADKSGVEFECTEFKTTGVTLPAYSA